MNEFLFLILFKIATTSKIGAFEDDELSLINKYCKNIKKEKLYEGERIYKCLTSIPFNEDVAYKTLKSLEEWMESYVFLDIYKNPPEGYEDYKIDIMEELENIYRLDFPNDYLFQMKVWEVFKNLQDSHTLYIPPEFYQVRKFHKI